ncbi:nudC domain-containing protein 2 isoform X1 [Rhodamnia argentea]|uniref:NudC domain-containing protein 2 isoform X1 n=1 Tax=Rhodamnia argentea TaxID=178133 RepID=A0A8B8PRJ6_9MYRT|nr:nudC domain-containing protein 2 isoform X1 [Rhodamnia argentea]
MAEKLAPEKRHIFSHNGQTVFEWDQTLEEVNMYIKLPPNVHPKQFYCKIQSKHVEVGIKGNPPYLNHDLTSPVKTDCSFWTLEDDIMHITLQKRDKGQTWSSPIQGQGQLDPYASDMEQKRLMLQRFQEELPNNEVLVDQLGFLVLQPFSTALLNIQRFLYELSLDEGDLFVQNPGFDFSQAQFTGNCPDPRTFMGGIQSG